MKCGGCFVFNSKLSQSVAVDVKKNPDNVTFSNGMRNFIVISCICALLTLGTILKRYSRDWPSIIFKK